MPCGDYSDNDTIHELSEQVKALTQFACELAQHIPDRSKLSKATQKWIADHEREDQRRIARELQDAKDDIARKRALKRLTRREKELLGL